MIRVLGLPPDKLRHHFPQIKIIYVEALLSGVLNVVERKQLREFSAVVACDHPGHHDPVPGTLADRISTVRTEDLSVEFPQIFIEVRTVEIVLYSGEAHKRSYCRISVRKPFCL